MDFQAQCLTVDISVSKPFAPIISDVCQVRLPAEPWQTVCSTWISSDSHMVDIVMQWSLAPVNHGSVLVSGLSQPGGQLVLVNDSGGQAFTAGNTGFGFNITCVPVDANSVTYVLPHFVLRIAVD